MKDHQLVFFFFFFFFQHWDRRFHMFLSLFLTHPIQMMRIFFFYSYMTTKLTPTGHWLLDYELYFEVLNVSFIRFSIYTELLPYVYYSPSSHKLPLGPYTAYHFNSSCHQTSPQGQSLREVRRSGPSIIRFLSSLSM